MGGFGLEPAGSDWSRRRTVLRSSPPLSPLYESFSEGGDGMTCESRGQGAAIPFAAALPSSGPANPRYADPMSFSETWGRPHRPNVDGSRR